MSATQSTPTPTFDVSGTPPIPFTRLLSVELRKSFDTRAGRWLMIVIAAMVIITEAIVLIVTVVQDQPASYDDFTAAAAFMTSFLLPVLGILLVSSEWSQRTAMVTFALEPRRPLVIAAKATAGVVLALATVVIALVVGLVCNLLYGAFQGNADWSIGWGTVLTFTVTQIFSMLGGFALATLFLNTPASIVVFFVYKWVLPVILGIGTALIGWFGGFAQWIDFQQAQGELYDPPITGAQWAHLVVSGVIWLVLPLVLGTMRVLRAEVK
jgi:ABC-type transport system involved in multi-copper enzyme maturation permease subunit